MNQPTSSKNKILTWQALGLMTLFLSLGLWQHRQWLRQSGTQGRRQLDHHVHHLLHSLHTHGR